MTKTRSVEEFETSLVQLYYKSDILFKYGASRNFEWNRKRELEWDRIFTILRKLHSKEISKIQTVFQLKTKIWKLIQMTKKKYQRHLLFPAYPKSFSKVEKLILKYEGIAMNGIPHISSASETPQQLQDASHSTEKENEAIKNAKEKVEYWLSYKFILSSNGASDGISDSESVASPTSMFFTPTNPFDPNCPTFQNQEQQQQQQQSSMEHFQCFTSDTSTHQMLNSETFENETEEKLVFCNTNDPQFCELLQILKENEKKNAEINGLRLERERIELEEAKIRLTLAEEEASRISNNNNCCSLQILEN